jgi:hypothetical protein
LILITNENIRYHNNNNLGLLVPCDISVASQYIKKQIRLWQQKDPQIQFLVVKVMTESMLKAYVKGKKASLRLAKQKTLP